jgi:RecA-family ATPase
LPRNEPSAFASNEAAPSFPTISATPFVWIDPASLPVRQWLYGRHLVRRFISATVAAGGFGKSSLITAEALAMVSGRPLLGEQPAGALRVWQCNLEDPFDELKRKVEAAALHHRVDPGDLESRFFLDSGRDGRFVIATEGSEGVRIAVPVVDGIRAEIVAKAIDVLQIDPFVASHTVAENDNTKIALVARQWAAIAEETGCAVELVHHVRKLGNGSTVLTVEDARGASALIAAVRSARVINAMQKEQAEHAGVDDRERYFSVIRGKANLAPRDDKTIWRRIVSVPLGNGPSPGLDDFVGVVEEWCWPDSFADVTVDKARDVQRRLSQGEW